MWPFKKKEPVKKIKMTLYKVYLSDDCDDSRLVFITDVNPAESYLGSKVITCNSYKYYYFPDDWEGMYKKVGSLTYYSGEIVCFETIEEYVRED